MISTATRSHAGEDPLLRASPRDRNNARPAQCARPIGARVGLELRVVYANGPYATLTVGRTRPKGPGRPSALSIGQHPAPCGGWCWRPAPIRLSAPPRDTSVRERRPPGRGGGGVRHFRAMLTSRRGTSSTPSTSAGARAQTASRFTTRNRLPGLRHQDRREGGASVQHPQEGGADRKEGSAPARPASPRATGTAGTSGSESWASREEMARGVFRERSPVGWLRWCGVLMSGCAVVHGAQVSAEVLVVGTDEGIAGPGEAFHPFDLVAGERSEDGGGVGQDDPYAAGR